ncbi:MAG: LysR family transcriptional regulator [Alphaproteobacteria bacterium]|nr:LysR family transcriptional regulator [Alphaproteobacteria bacterium]
MRFTLKQLQYFVATGETGSIKLASERLNISQPSISSAISHLERDLGVQLFVRHHAQGLSLTSAGHRVLREARALLLQANGIYDVANETTNLVRGHLALGCFVTLAPMIVPELCHRFQEKHVEVQVHPIEGDHEALMAQLRKVDLDVVLTYDLQIPDGVTFEALATLPPHVLVSADHPLADRSSIALSELDGEPLILLDLPFSREYFLSIFYHEGLSPKIHARSRQQEVVRTMVANGYGYTLANVRPRNLTTLDGRTLKQIPLEGEHRPMKIGIATLAQERKPRLLQAFEEHCRAMITNGGVPGMQ